MTARDLGKRPTAFTFAKYSFSCSSLTVRGVWPFPIAHLKIFSKKHFRSFPRNFSALSHFYCSNSKSNISIYRHSHICIGIYLCAYIHIYIYVDFNTMLSHSINKRISQSFAHGNWNEIGSFFRTSKK